MRLAAFFRVGGECLASTAAAIIICARPDAGLYLPEVVSLLMVAVVLASKALLGRGSGTAPA
jgi:hypothetical protein